MLSTYINPRFSDTDALGHINNTVIPVWFLEARAPILAWFAPQGDLTRGAIVVVRIEVDYLAETRFGVEVEIRTRVARIGISSFKLKQEVWQDGIVTARGLATLVSFNSETRKAKPLSETEKQQLSRHLGETGV